MRRNSMVNQVRAEMERSRLTYRQISEGAGLSLSWVQKFGNDKISNPTINRLDSLHRFLVSQEGRKAA